jgi:hypothetical protein
MDDDHQAVAAEPLEVLVDQIAGLDRLRAGGLPAGTGQRMLDLRREHAEADGEHDPADEDRAEVGGGAVTEPPDGPELVHRTASSAVSG